jgi:fluoride exporter
MKNFLLVAAGGALGSVARYGVGVLLAGASRGFPWGTLAVNVLGSVVIGAVIATTTAGSAPRLLLGVGVCGGFTTFSAFGAELVTLMEAGQAGRAALYAGASVALGIAAVVVGLGIGRAVAGR